MKICTQEFDRAIIVSSDGDFSSLVDFLIEKKRMDMILSPNDSCSILLIRTRVAVTYVRQIRKLIEKEKALDGDATP